MPVDRKTTNRGILTKNFRRLTDRLYRIHREPNGYAPDRWTDLRRSRKSHRRDADSDEPGLYRGLVGGSSTCKYQSVEEAEAQSQAGCTEYNAFVVRADCFVHFRRKYLKD